MKEEIKKAITLLIVVLIILAAVWIVTEIMNDKVTSSDGKTTTTTAKSSVNTDASYSNMIMLSNVFNISKDEYMVLFYSNKNKKDSLDAVIKLYDSKDKDVKLYKVNYDEAINSSVLSKEDNKEAASAEELKVSGVTLITITNGKITSYINNEDDILNALE